jgi:hypothetical protein
VLGAYPPSHLPAGCTERLAATANSDGSIPHPWQCGHSDVFGARVGEPLVHLIHETDDIVSLAQLCHHRKFLCRE